jgi:hypothetical protein
MNHDLTIICDDIRQETGRKISLMGLYDEALLFKRVPARLAKLCMFQRWLGTDHPEKMRIEIRGSALSASVTAEAEGEHPNPVATRLNLMVALAPFDVVNTGEVEFVTYFGDAAQPSHSHKIEIRVDPKLAE